jgi:histidine ammonia-lyase
VDAVRGLGVPGPGADRWLAPEVDALVGAVRSGALVAAAESALATPLT